MKSVIPVLACVLALSGCAMSVPLTPLETVQPQPLAGLEPAALLYVDLKAYSGNSSMNAVESVLETRRLQQVVQPILMDSGQFAAVSFDQADIKRASRRLQLDIYQFTNENQLNTTAMLQLLSCGVIPWAYRQSVSLKIKLMDSDGQITFRDSRQTETQTKAGWIYAGHPDKTEKNVQAAIIRQHLLAALNASQKQH